MAKWAEHTVYVREGSVADHALQGIFQTASHEDLETEFIDWTEDEA